MNLQKLFQMQRELDENIEYGGQRFVKDFGKRGK